METVVITTIHAKTGTFSLCDVYQTRVLQYLFGKLKVQCPISQKSVIWFGPVSLAATSAAVIARHFKTFIYFLYLSDLSACSHILYLFLFFIFIFSSY
jgi:hypothetical protein